MWLHTVYGFYSVVSANKQKKGRPKKVMVRARVRAHLVNLIEKFSELASSKIIVNTRRDYWYRIIVSQEMWAKVVAQMVLAIDYTNFKDAVVKYDEHVDSGYEDALHGVWFDMLKLQRPRRWKSPKHLFPDCIEGVRDTGEKE